MFQYRLLYIWVRDKSPHTPPTIAVILLYMGVGDKSNGQQARPYRNFSFREIEYSTVKLINKWRRKKEKKELCWCYNSVVPNVFFVSEIPKGHKTNRHHDCFTKKNPKTSSIDIIYGTNSIDTNNTTVWYYTYGLYSTLIVTRVYVGNCGVPSSVQ